MIDMGLYRRFYRQKRRAFAGAGDGAIREGARFSTSSSTSYKDTKVNASGPAHLEDVGTIDPGQPDVHKAAFPGIEPDTANGGFLCAEAASSQ